MKNVTSTISSSFSPLINLLRIVTIQSDVPLHPTYAELRSEESLYYEDIIFL